MLKAKTLSLSAAGDTAMDCVRTAIRQGAKSVKCLYRRDRANMPGSQREVENAEKEGVDFQWLSAPVSFKRPWQSSKSAGGFMHLGIADGSGRQSVKPIDGSDFELDADIVIEALGFGPENIPTLFDEPDLKVSRWGTIEIDEETKMTSLDGVFAAGDIQRGASLVVWAIRDAQDAVEEMHQLFAQNALSKAS